MADDRRCARFFKLELARCRCADYPTIVMGHGGGGKLGNELVEHLFLPAFRNPALENLGDAAVFELGSGRIAMSTDSFVVQPLFFPGGSIGALAVNGTVNDLAVSGAEPKFLSASFILEEGFPLAQLAAVVRRHGRCRAQRPAFASSPAIPRSSSAATAMAATSTRRASACCGRASTSGRIARRLATSCLSPAPSAITAWRS